jgi:hypothetical protein
MALQLGLRRGLTSIATKSLVSKSAYGGLYASSNAARWKSTDAGDVIGIDLGTTNSCVAIMVRAFIAAFGCSSIGLFGMLHI